MGLQMPQIPHPHPHPLTHPQDFVFTTERPHYSLASFSSFICECTTLAKNLFVFKSTLDYLPKKPHVNEAEMVNSVCSVTFSSSGPQK